MIEIDKVNNALLKNHFDVICNFLNYLNRSTEDFILKGDTSLVVCYGLDRFTEDIDLDSVNKNIENYMDQFCKTYNYSYHFEKNTNAVKRFLIHYSDNHKPLKIEVSYRQLKIDPSRYTKMNGVQVYNIDELFVMKLFAYSGRDKITDVYDTIFIYKNYKDKLSQTLITSFKNVLQYKGFEYVDYLMHTEKKDGLINYEKLQNDILDLFSELDLLDDYEFRIA